MTSRSAERGREFASDLRVPERRRPPTFHVFEDVNDMLAEIDVLYVATPHPMHAAAALPALGSGTAVLVEKAITSRYADAARLVEASRASGAFRMEAIWTRFMVLCAKARELIADGVLGDILRIVADFSFCFPLTETQHRLRNPALGGGALLDMGPYPVSLIQSLLGEPTALAICGSLAVTGDLAPRQITVARKVAREVAPSDDAPAGGLEWAGVAEGGVALGHVTDRPWPLSGTMSSASSHAGEESATSVTSRPARPGR